MCSDVFRCVCFGGKTKSLIVGLVYNGGGGDFDLFTDAEAAIGMTQREGVGRTRHIDTGLLWIQQKERNFKKCLR